MIEPDGDDVTQWRMMEPDGGDGDDGAGWK